MCTEHILGISLDISMKIIRIIEVRVHNLNLVYFILTCLSLLPNVFFH